MRVVEVFVAELIVLFSKGVFWVLASVVSASLVAAPILLLIRVIYWLRLGDWITSICEGHVRLLIHKRSRSFHDQPFLCVDSNTGWLGIDQISDWIFLRGDMSLVLFLICVTLFGILMFTALILRFVPPENWLRRYYESR